ncbi:hypothetical protein PX554_19870 [Sphingomonas sp. H39-1-10]|uniref:hypothetical protein n=1 Tax=Sphingomonas pollutisoli TaxID=3030829 RepID=UPI0023B900F5|nr:hypothetical protein [Sphingomonas pollutisoli]MDF0490390.1 hypothetical protein [Sphingomonas pollutisoli]
MVQRMSVVDFENWAALYAATALCCLMAALAAGIAVGVELYRERAWTQLASVRGAIAFVPRTWWRWQRRYLLATPMILAIVTAFGVTLDW